MLLKFAPARKVRMIPVRTRITPIGTRNDNIHRAMRLPEYQRCNNDNIANADVKGPMFENIRESQRDDTREVVARGSFYYSVLMVSRKYSFSVNFFFPFCFTYLPGI